MTNPDPLPGDEDLEDGMSEWVSTSESLPESDVEVLVFAPDELEKVFTAAYYLNSWNRQSGGIRAVEDDFFGDPDFVVTHWMPLPEPPIGDEQ